jgi:hypothetical protein
MISFCNRSFWAPLKSKDFDKQPLALSVYLIDLELEGFETPKNFSFLVAVYHSIARAGENCWVKMLAHIVIIAESNSGEKA